QPILDVVAVLASVGFVALVCESGNLGSRGAGPTPRVVPIQPAPVMSSILTSELLTFMTSPQSSRRSAAQMSSSGQSSTSWSDRWRARKQATQKSYLLAATLCLATANRLMDQVDNSVGVRHQHRMRSVDFDRVGRRSAL